MIDPLLEIGPRVTALPIVHGSGDFAWEVRRIMAAYKFDCVALPLPASFQGPVERAVLDLPMPSVVVQKDLRTEFDTFFVDDENRADDQDGHEELELGASYVPVDPCQGVIAAIRTAMGEHLPRHFIDLETAQFRPHRRLLPDAYALKQVPIQQYAAAVLPFLKSSPEQQWWDRVNYMGWQLKQLSVDYERILLICSILDWPWIRAAYMNRELRCPEHDPVNEPEQYQVDPDTLYFLLGELPFITELYERARAELSDDAHLSIDGIKELLISARKTYQADYGNRSRKITPRLLAVITKYIRNLALMDHSFSPQLVDVVTAAKQVIGDGYALQVLATAKEYGYRSEVDLPKIRMGIDQSAFPDDSVCRMSSRLPGPPVTWSQIELVPRPDKNQVSDWKQKWNPYQQCSWPPEDELIENFRRAVFDRAAEVMGADLAKTEKFTSSVKDGIDIRDTVRHWYDEDIYVKVLPPNQGRLDCAVMLFDAPADPRHYPWRTTWFAEHENESTLAFYASSYLNEPVGPGICLAHYGGSLFLFPPVTIPDIWIDPRLDFTSTLEERLLAAACLHAQSPHIALVSAAPPGPAWRMLAKEFKKTWVHLPLSRFSDSTVQQLRMVHVLNGKQVRSYAADFIRRS
ncbi:MAG: hypothetical protein P8K79_03055 [Mariniblastus sp.]|nr:hypothetical protein [Mariniblastus sp.]